MSKRFVIILFVNLGIILFWLIYLFFVQIVDFHNFSKYNNKRNIPYKNKIVAKRGNIFDRNLHKLTDTDNFYQIDIDRSILLKHSKKKNLDYKNIYSFLAFIISKHSKKDNQEQIFQRLYNDKKFTSIFIADGVTESSKREIQETLAKNDIPGIIFNFTHMERKYPYQNLLKPILGYTKNIEIINYDNNSKSKKIKGVTGLEYFYDEILSGEDGWEKYYANGTPYISNLKDEKKEKVDGSSIFLTIDIRIQQIIEHTLKEKINEFQAKVGIGVVMDPNTGEILAMSGFQNNETRDKLMTSYMNLPASYIFTPGSTIKPFIMLGALQNKLYSTGELINTSDYHLEYGNRIIKDHTALDRESNMLSFFDVLTYSSNVGIVKIGEKLGEKKVYNLLTSFGFGKNLLTDIHDGSSGIFRDLSKWNKYSLTSISFGHEIGVTPIQLTTAYATFANGGYLVKPFIVKRIKNYNGKEIKKKKKVLAKIAKKDELDTLRLMMKSVVERGTAKETKIDGIPIAGKTGTAREIARSNNEQDTYSTSFCGYFPADNPRYIMLIMFEGVQEQYSYASLSAVPTFREIVKRMILSPEINVINPKKANMIVMPNLIGLTMEQAKDLADNLGIKYSFIIEKENLLVSDQSPAVGTEFDKNLSVNIYFGKKQNKRDNFVGLSLRNAIEKAIKDSLKISLKGQGVIFKQTQLDEKGRNFLLEAK